MAVKSANPKPHRRVEAWIYTAINPVIEALRDEAAALREGYLGWRGGPGYALVVRPIRERLAYQHLPNLDDLLDERPELEAQLADRNVSIELTDEARNWLVDNGYDELMGARPMARVIQQTIKTPLADELLFGRLKSGGTVRVVVTADEQGVKKLGFVYPEGPVLPRPEREIVGVGRKRKPKAEPEVFRARVKKSGEAPETPPAAPTAEGGTPPVRSVPGVPLKG